MRLSWRGALSYRGRAAWSPDSATAGYGSCAAAERFADRWSQAHGRTRDRTHAAIQASGISATTSVAGRPAVISSASAAGDRRISFASSSGSPAPDGTTAEARGAREVSAETTSRFTGNLHPIGGLSSLHARLAVTDSSAVSRCQTFRSADHDATVTRGCASLPVRGRDGRRERADSGRRRQPQGPDATEIEGGSRG